jgi:FAD/FMN-containing dehydrogenase
VDLTRALVPPTCGCLKRHAGGPADWGFVPTRTETPRSAPDAARLLAEAARVRTPHWIVGSASRLAALPPTPRSAIALSTAGLAGIVAYEPADLTLTARAGTTLETVHDLLAPDRLELPASHFGLAGGTLGGAVATNLSDARRGAAGPLRDRILGMEIATSDGNVTRSGGRVVKNVAGYDVGRLIAGSHGGLALVTEVTLRLSPMPEAHAPFTRAFASAHEAAGHAFALAQGAPALGLVSVVASNQVALLTWVHEGDAEAVEEGVRWSEARHGKALATDAHDHPAPVESRLALKALEHVCPERTNVLLKAGVRPSRVADLLATWSELGPTFLGAHAMHGAAFARFDLGDPAKVRWAHQACLAAQTAGGWWRWQGAWRAGDGPGAAPWGGIETPWPLYARLKQAFDPGGLLGPSVYAGEAAR